MKQHQGKDSRPPLVADWQHLMRTFIRPEDEASRAVLTKYMEQILFGLHDFLASHVGVTRERTLKELAEAYSDASISPAPEKKLDEIISELIEEVAPHAVNVSSPYFVGHMTSAIPFFMVHLRTIVAALNQNVVKLETSKILSVIEKQVLAKIHRMVFQREAGFYARHVQHPETMLGAFTENGTLANFTALWAARNRLFAPGPGFAGIEVEGVHAAYRHKGVRRCVVLASRLGHYSLRKAAGLLGIGNEQLVVVEMDSGWRVDLDKLAETVRDLTRPGSETAVLAIVGIAGTTETGTVDPLEPMAEICAEHGIHFHVDAAWGGPTLLSGAFRGLLSGIEKADSVAIDGHKQFYMPMTSGMVFFRDPTALDAVAYHARYINRPGSVDLGIRSISGSREATSLMLDCALRIMGAEGYALLIDHGIETAKAFAAAIEKRKDFELITAPELNILTYRLCSRRLQQRLESCGQEERRAINERLNRINRDLQRRQREAGKSFVSRTTLSGPATNNEQIVVLRTVIMNPMTTVAVLEEILDEQERIFAAMNAAAAPENAP
ncbi:MAG: putative pyridoxal-dependent aspartate 1-decarboxylase [Desulfobacterales bacterium]|nr:putative pyridoxal-dependent aspartate 1-decarboxylase [Desulfobacterales bacterium]